ncbi:GFA family protein [Mangrovimicrobium sediminis]|uniref:GFA family protein n=1 Tax=Mangrovimicrobium sediminis TaxID=2562682 RepID=A0A4Z0M1B7_9GAMM|nr:GFA family protein [Haliea sp. SAOS-164]TGD73402.1 GFA family protein [Haliea sp. SAOS-164]
MIEGACHCGAVRWTYKPEVEGATACNCTICRRYGALWAYDYENQGVTVQGATAHYVRGEDIEFHFCAHCGCTVYWRGRRDDEQGRRRIAVNLRLAEPQAVAAIPIDHFDGLDTFTDLPRDGKCIADLWA